MKNVSEIEKFSRNQAFSHPFSDVGREVISNCHTLGGFNLWFLSLQPRIAMDIIQHRIINVLKTLRDALVWFVIQWRGS